MSRKTTKAPRQRELYRAEGLLLPVERHYSPGRCGVEIVEPADTQARETIIVSVRDRLNNFPGAHFEHRYAANELNFLGYDLYGQAGADHTRNFLVTFRRAWALAARPPLRQEDQSASEKNPAQERAYIQRRVKTVFDRAGVPRGLDPDALDIRDVVSYLLLNEHGLAPRAFHGALTPQLPAQHFDEQADILADRARISDQRIAWAISEARTYAGQVGPQFAAHLVSLTGIPEAELARISLIGHGYCTTRHSLDQAMLPHLAATLALHPDGAPVTADDPFLLLKQVYRDLGGLITGYLGS